jgi:hypothetical protein
MTQFSLKRLLLVVTCFAVAFAAISRLSIHQDANTLGFVIVAGTAIGSGIGSLANRFLLGLALGVLLSASVAFVMAVKVATGKF